jgi:hypothetical protein
VGILPYCSRLSTLAEGAQSEKGVQTLPGGGYPAAFRAKIYHAIALKPRLL